MRNEREVFAQLLDFARSSPLVRAVTLNGSRLNPSAPPDIFQDYDVVFFVTDPRHFRENQAWIAGLGELIIQQQNEFEDVDYEGYIFLMLFSDGVRIDLSFAPAARLPELLDDSLTAVLLDKDGRIGQLPPPSEAGYFIPRPSEVEFAETANEFWWCSTNIAKGLWRDELVYARTMLDCIVRPCLLKMLAWNLSTRSGWRTNPGGYDKWLKRLLPPEQWQALERTYTGPDPAAMWQGLFEAGRLFRQVGVETAAALGYPYPHEDDCRVSEYLARVQRLPRDAVGFDEEPDA